MPSYYCPISRISVEITTDEYPEDTRWELRNDSSLILSGGSYTKRYTKFKYEQCLIEGLYKFVIYDSWGDGIYGNGGYKIRLNNKIVKQGGGDDGFQDFEEYTFEITKPSDAPSDILSDAPSDILSNAPSHTPSKIYSPPTGKPTSKKTTPPPTSKPTSKKRLAKPKRKKNKNKKSKKKPGKKQKKPGKKQKTEPPKRHTSRDKFREKIRKSLKKKPQVKK